MRLFNVVVTRLFGPKPDISEQIYGACEFSEKEIESAPKVVVQDLDPDE